MRVVHDLRGGGTVSEVDEADTRGKPYHVHFDNGEARPQRTHRATFARDSGT
jgi:hypothetical protein